ncbi:pseudouridine synthase [Candidatus Peregrinibacteria bacterium]|nr:pseudouridine synthase [Candidatus Peregrinibacteria bacterium]
MRINKYIASTGLCSRRSADQLIEQGKVKINGKIAIQGDRVEDGQEVFVDGKLIRNDQDKVYIAFHKPYGVIVTDAENATNKARDYIDIEKRLFAVGRLDVNSTGLLICTNDGDVVNLLSKAENKIEKEYLVVVKENVTPVFLQKMSEGVRLDEGKTLPAHVKKHGHKGFLITLVQGWNRQIRRMCEKLGYQVVSLKRVRFGKMELGNLQVGEWRYIKKNDLL